MATTESIRKQIDKELKQLSKTEKVAIQIGTTLLSETTERIFSRGLNSKGRKIGNYSTRPTLAGATSFANKKGANKYFGSKKKRKAQDWKTVNSSSQALHLIVIQGGYSEIRQASGRPTGSVNLDFTGQFRASYTSTLEKKNIGVIGFLDIKRKNNLRTATSKTKNGEILASIESKYGNVFGLTKKELKIVDKLMDNELKIKIK